MQETKRVCPNCGLTDLKQKEYYKGSKRQCLACKAIITFDSKGEIKTVERAELT